MIPAPVAIGTVIGVLAGIAILLACMVFFVTWLWTAADLVLACLLRPWKALTATLSITGALLAIISLWTHPLIGLTVAGWFAPPLAIFALNLMAWSRNTAAERTAAAFFTGAWRGAFYRTEQARQRASYQAPQVVHDAEF